MCTFGVIQRSLVARAVDPLGQLIAPNQAQGVIAPLGLGVMQGILKHLHPPWQHGGPQAAKPIVDIETMALWQFTHFIGGPAHAVPQAPSAFDAEGFFQRRHVA
ncbi:hypothetical protein D3C79_984430 [compost metagenome]